jgi:hypothetical protein
MFIADPGKEIRYFVIVRSPGASFGIGCEPIVKPHHATKRLSATRGVYVPGQARIESKVFL